jgi:hypothetical protein
MEAKEKIIQQTGLNEIPKSIWIICILNFFYLGKGLISAILLMQLFDEKWIPISYSFISIAGIIACGGLLARKKWALYAYTTICVINLIFSEPMGGLNALTFIFSTIALIVVWSNAKKMFGKINEDENIEQNKDINIKEVIIDPDLNKVEINSFDNSKSLIGRVIFSTKERRIVIVLMLINFFALFVNFFGISSSIELNNNPNINKKIDILTNSIGLVKDYPHEVIFSENVKEFWPLCTFNKYTYDSRISKNGRIWTNFNGIFTSYDFSEFIFYTLLIFGFFIIKKIW